MPVMTLTGSASTIYSGASLGGDGKANPIVGHVGIANRTQREPVTVCAWFNTNKPMDEMGGDDDAEADHTFTLNPGEARRVGGSFVTAFCAPNKTAIVEIF